MQAVMDAVVPYVHDRKQFGQSIGEFQLIQAKLADMYTVLQAARLPYTVGKNLDALGPEHVRRVRKDCASVILWCAEKATWMAGEGVQIFGGNGYINDYPLGRLWRDAKLYEIGAGTSEIRRMLIGRELFRDLLMSESSANSAQANFRLAEVKARSAGRSQIGAGTSEIRRMLIGRELFSETC